MDFFLCLIVVQGKRDFWDFVLGLSGRFVYYKVRGRVGRQWMDMRLFVCDICYCEGAAGTVEMVNMVD